MYRESIGWAGIVISSAATGVSHCSGMYWEVWVYMGYCWKVLRHPGRLVLEVLIASGQCFMSWMMGSGLQETWDILPITGTCWDIMGMPTGCIALLILYSKDLIIMKWLFLTCMTCHFWYIGNSWAVLDRPEWQEESACWHWLVQGDTIFLLIWVEVCIPNSPFCPVGNWIYWANAEVLLTLH